ncbi:MAG: NUDIX hydrolase [Patescibacteria group bacterium]|nr:NUDIX hydrolase [Patescibacteria group bacterium]
MRTIKREIVSGLLFSKDKRLLMVKKNPTGGGVYIDCWHIPGGGVDQGENKTQALRRELKEEIGLEVEGYATELVNDEGTGTSEKTLKDTNERVLVEMHFNVYRIDINDRNSSEVKVQLDDELSEYKWFTLEELAKVKLTPPSKSLFAKLVI